MIIAEGKITTRQKGYWFWVLTRPEAFLPASGGQARVFLHPCTATDSHGQGLPHRRKAHFELGQRQDALFLS